VTGYLIDTNVLSSLRRPEKHPAVVRWFSSIESDEFYLSVLTLGEIRQGIERLRLKDAKAARSIERWFAGIREHYQNRVLPIDEAVVERWGRLPARQPLPAIDGLLAATALTHNLTISTHNTADFLRSGASCVNPFEFRD
jgi:predicted nucleic acid-binding protein